MGNSLYSSPSSQRDNTEHKHKQFAANRCHSIFPSRYIQVVYNGTVSGKGSAGTVVTCCSESAVEQLELQWLTASSKGRSSYCIPQLKAALMGISLLRVPEIIGSTEFPFCVSLLATQKKCLFSSITTMGNALFRHHKGLHVSHITISHRFTGACFCLK